MKSLNEPTWKYETYHKDAYETSQTFFDNLEDIFENFDNFFLSKVEIKNLYSLIYRLFQNRII